MCAMDSLPSISQVTRLAALEAQIVKQDASSNESSSDVDEGDAFEEGRCVREGSGLVREDMNTDDVRVLSAATAQAEDQWLGIDGLKARCVFSTRCVYMCGPWYHHDKIEDHL